MADEDERFPAGPLRGVVRCHQLEKPAVPANSCTDLILLTVNSLNSGPAAKAKTKPICKGEGRVLAVSFLLESRRIRRRYRRCG